jgi:hypothetical protein
MKPSRKSRVNTIQNFLIAMLTVSAILLLLYSPSAYLGGASGEYLSGLFSSDVSKQNPDSDQLTSDPAPVHIAVTGAYGRYGNLSLTTTDTDFSALGTLLREALGSAGALTSCTEKDFRSALNGTNIYYDFCTELPLSVLAGLVGAEMQDSLQTARRLVIAPGTLGTSLFLSSENRFLRCTTRVRAAELSDAVGQYQLGNAVFAFESGGGENLAPYSLFLTGDTSGYSVLNSADALSDTDALLTALNFNPHTNSRYPGTGNTEVIVDGNRSVHIGTDGTVLYQGGESDALQISAEDSSPTAREVAIGCFRLLTSVLKNSGDASLCLKSIHQVGQQWTLTFDYHISGTLILQNSGPAATVMLSGNTVTSVRFRIRRYTKTTDNCSILPVTQALAVAEKYPGRELAICYSDSGSENVSAGWLARSD